MMTRLNTTEANAGLADLLAKSASGNSYAMKRLETMSDDLAAEVLRLTALVADLTAANAALAADNARLGKRVDEARGVIKSQLDRDMRNTCQHENTHRGGFLWEICDDCGCKWADDTGVKPAWADPAEWQAARAWLAGGDA